MRLIITLSIFFFSTILTGQSTFQSYFSEGVPFTEPLSIITTSDGGFLVSGNTTQEGTLNTNFYVIKLDKNGKEDWSLIQDFDLGAYFDICFDAVELTDYFIVSALVWNLSEDALPYPHIITLNKENGNIENIKPIKEYPYQYFTKIDKTSNEDIILFGYVSDLPENFAVDGIKPMTLIKRSITDGVIWSKSFEETEVKPDLSFATNDMVIKDNYFYLGGGGEVNDTSSVLHLVKTDTSGNLIWQKEFTNTLESNSIASQSDGIVLSTNYSMGENSLLFKFTFDGDLVWQKSYVDYLDKISTCITNLQDEIFILGNNDSHIVLLKTDSSGEILWSKEFSPVLPIKYYHTRDCSLTSDGGIAITGAISIENIAGTAGIFVYRLNSEGEFGDILDTSSTPLFNTASIDIYPNPTTDIINIQNEAETIEELQVTLFDMKANKIHQETMNGQQSDINMENLPAGSYILELRNKKNQAYQKLVVKQ